MTQSFNLQYIAQVAAFGHRLRELRTDKKVGMKSLARSLGISHTYISHLERGKAQPSEAFVRKLAAYFKVDEESLLLTAGKFPHDIEEILDKHPQEVVTVLRSFFATQR